LTSADRRLMEPRETRDHYSVVNTGHKTWRDTTT
jgi:hypothetical protein